MSQYEPPDFYNIDDLLSEEQRMVAATVRKFVDDRVMPSIEQHFREGTFPTQLIAEMGQLGFLGPIWTGMDARIWARSPTA